jgi:hypothetical protein
MAQLPVDRGYLNPLKPYIHGLKKNILEIVAFP